MPLFESAIGGIAVSVFDQAINAGKYAAKEIRGAYSKVEHEQRVIKAAKAYEENYLNRQCKIKIMPGLMKEPLDLEKIYTTVKLLDDNSRRLFMGLEELEKGYRARGKRVFSSGGERLKGIDIANSRQFLMVLGGPGIGKSTFLRKIGLETLKQSGKVQHDCIPVFLELKKFREERVDIKQKITEEFEIFRFPATEVLVDSALEQGKLLVLFDGLDEVPSQKLNHVIEQIEDFVDRHDNNRFVASCRIAAYRSSFRRFTDVTIAEFDDEQIEQFIDRWFGSAEDEALGTADKYRELLFQKKHKATKELAQTPLLLTFLCLVYDREQTLPSKRSTLYERALNIILHEWSAQKRIERDPIYEGFHPELEKLMLAKIAYDSFKQDQLFFSKETVTKQIAEFLADTLDAPRYLDADKVLTAIEVQQGILVERATDAYSFSHLTLQEYLTALHVIETRRGKELVNEHLIHRNWREVFLAVSGLVSNRSVQLLIAIDQRVRTYISPYPKLKKLLKWAAVNKVGASELSQRAAMLAVVIDSTRTSDKASSIFGNSAINSARDIVSDIASDIVSDIASDIARANANDKAIAIARANDSDITIAIVSARDVARDIVSDIDIVSARDRAGNSSRAGNRDRSRAIAIDRASNIAVAIDRAIDRASAIAIASNIASNTDHHFLNTQQFELIAIELSNHRDNMPTSSDSPKKWQVWASRLQLIWLEVLEISADDVTFSEEEAKALQDYLYAERVTHSVQGGSYSCASS